jgi:hypothetical protein
MTQRTDVAAAMSATPFALPYLTPALAAALLTTGAAVLLLVSCQTPPKGTPAPPAVSPVMSPHPGTSAPVDPSFIYRMAQVESVSAVLAADGSPRATVTVSGLLNDGATSLHEIKQQRTSNGVVLTLVTVRPRDAIATLALIPFERTFAVELTGLPPGPCTISAHGQETLILIP